MGALVDVLHVCGREYGGVFRCMGLGLLQCRCCWHVASPFYFGGFMLVFLCFIPFCHYYVRHFTIKCPFCWLVAIHFLHSGLLVTGIYLGLA